MSHVVAKPFKTVNRRFAIGVEIRESDDLSPHSFADLKERGFITAASAAPSSSAANASRAARGRADKTDAA
jgi:hypothetical protein